MSQAWCVDPIRHQEGKGTGVTPHLPGTHHSRAHYGLTTSTLPLPPPPSPQNFCLSAGIANRDFHSLAEDMERIVCTHTLQAANYTATALILHHFRTFSSGQLIPWMSRPPPVWALCTMYMYIHVSPIKFNVPTCVHVGVHSCEDGGVECVSTICWVQRVPPTDSEIPAQR